MKKAKTIALTVLALLLAFELLAPRVVPRWRHRVRIDSTLGWINLPNAVITRPNADDVPWTFAINSKGFRGPENWNADAKTRILVIGDSFAFGEGIAIEDRFDTILSRRHPEWSFVNLSVGGWGTDQELIASRSMRSQLRARDVLLIVTCWNDLYDLSRRVYAGRAKPWFELSGDRLVEHAPAFGVVSYLRDKLYLAGALAVLRERATRFSPETLRASLCLYERLLASETREVAERGAFVVIAHFQDRQFADQAGLKVQELEVVFDRLCAAANVHCVSLDSEPDGPIQSSMYQRDEHWNASGDRAVASVLERHLGNLLRAATPAP